MLNSNGAFDIKADSESDILIESSTPSLYTNNAFRVLELPVDATPRDIMKRQQMIEMARKTGMPIPPGPARYLPLLKSPPDEDAIRHAVQRLQDPERRMVDELFWFWPHSPGQSKTDEGLRTLGQGDAEKTKALWTKQAMQQSESFVSLHNLAILTHVSVLENGNNKQEELWKKTYKNWKDVINYEGFWSRVTVRIRELDDPRLTTGIARRMRKSFPTALLSINAILGVKAAEQGDLDTAKRHKKIMQTSGWDPEEALRMAVQPVRDRIEILCKAAEPNADADPMHADEVARRLLDQAHPLLTVLDCMLPSDNSTLIHAHDEVALRTRSCQITFGNKTENWKRSGELLEQALAVAISESARIRIKDDLSIVSKNTESNVGWSGEGYFDFPEPVLSLAEEAREKADLNQYDEAIDILKGILMDATKKGLTEKEIKLIRKPLADTLNKRWVSKHNPAMDRCNATLDFINNLLSGILSKKNMLFDKLLEIDSSIYCDNCGTGIYGDYIKFTYKDMPFNLCLTCKGKMEKEEEAKKNELRKVIENTADDLFLARELDPDKEVIGENITILKKLASDTGAKLPNGLLLLIQSGLATYSELVNATRHSSSAIHKAAIKQFEKIDPDLARQTRKKNKQLKKRALELAREKRNKRLKIGAFMLAAGVSAIFILILGYNLIAYFNGNPAATRRAYEYGLLSQKTVVSKLIIALKDSDSDVRKASADALGKIGPAAKKAVPALIAVLRDSNWKVHKTSADALGKIGLEAVPALIAALKDSNWIVRYASADALGKIGPSAKEAVPALIAALKDNDSYWQARSAAAEALGKIGHFAKEAVPTLSVALKDSDRRVRTAAKKALEAIQK